MDGAFYEIIDFNGKFILSKKNPFGRAYRRR